MSNRWLLKRSGQKLLLLSVREDECQRALDEFEKQPPDCSAMCTLDIFEKFYQVGDTTEASAKAPDWFADHQISGRTAWGRCFCTSRGTFRGVASAIAYFAASGCLSK